MWIFSTSITRKLHAQKKVYVQQLRIKDLALQRWQGEATPVVAPLFQASLVFLFIYLINVISTIVKVQRADLTCDVTSIRLQWFDPWPISDEYSNFAGACDGHVTRFFFIKLQLYLILSRPSVSKSSGEECLWYYNHINWVPFMPSHNLRKIFIATKQTK